MRFIHGGFVMAKLEGRAQVQARKLSRALHPISDVDRVLQVRKKNALFDYEIAHLKGPDRQTVLEAELAQIIRSGQIELTAGAFLRA